MITLLLTAALTHLCEASPTRYADQPSIVCYSQNKVQSTHTPRGS